LLKKNGEKLYGATVLPHPVVAYYRKMCTYVRETIIAVSDV